jgi:hypothetical protein
VTIIPTASTPIFLPDETFGLNPACAHLIAKFRSNPPQWLLDMRTENQKEQA